MYSFKSVPILTGRLKMFCRLSILLFFSSLFWTPTVSHVIHKRAAFYIANETMCIVDGDVYRNGDPVPTDDECERCTCRPPGFSCVLRDCDTKPGCKAVRRAGECCPEYVCGCVHNSRLYEDGELIKDLQNNCYTCRCHGSSISCTFADCHFRSDCPPEYIPGECCPRYDHCPFESFMPPFAMTTTTTTSPHIIQQEIDFFNLTTQHVKKFTSEGTIVKVEDITTPVAITTTPAYTHIVKFTLSGENISSIHDFEAKELTTLLPVQTVTYKDTTRHIIVPQDTELMTIKDIITVASHGEMTESPSTFVSETDIKLEAPAKTSDATSLLNTTSADTDESASKSSITEDNVITILSEDVSDWDDELKVVQEAESSSFESDFKGQETITDFDVLELSTDEITQQESSRTQTEIPISIHTIQSTLEDFDHLHTAFPEGTLSPVHSNITSEEKFQTDQTTDFKVVTDLLSTTTIDDETITRKDSQWIDNDLQSPLENVFDIYNVSSTQISDSTETSEKLDTISAHTESDDDIGSLITKIAISTTIKSTPLDAQSEVDIETKSTEPSEEMQYTTSDNLLSTVESTKNIAEISQQVEISDSFSDVNTMSEISTAHDIGITTQSLNETVQQHIESQSDPVDITAQTETSVNLFTTDSDNISSTYHTINLTETFHEIESVDKKTSIQDFQSPIDNLFSTPDYKESTTIDSTSVTFSSTPEYSSSLDIKTSISLENIEGSSEIVEPNITSTTKDISTTLKPISEFDKYSTITISHLETVESTKPSISENTDASEIDTKYGSTVKPEVSGYNVKEETTEDFDKEELLNKTDFGLTSFGETQEAEAESEEITTESFPVQTSSTHLTHDESTQSEDMEIKFTTEQTKEDETTTKMIITKEIDLTDDPYNVDYNATYESLTTKSTAMESTDSSETDIPIRNTSHVLTEETFSATDLTTYSTENLTDLFKVTDIDSKENTSQNLISVTDSSTVHSVDIMPISTDTSTMHSLNTSETLPETATNKVTFGINEEELDPVKQQEDISAESDELVTQTEEFVKITTMTPTTISSTTEDDMPNELPAFEPPLANILKQQMLFNRPISEKDSSSSHNTKSNLSKDTSDENQIDRLSLTVQETDESFIDQDELGNKIISFNQEYTIQDSEILSTSETPDKEKSSTLEENKNNLYLIKIKPDDETQTSNNGKTTTQIIYNLQSASEIKDSNINETYNENEDVASVSEIMDSEDLSSETTSEERFYENTASDEVSTSLYEPSIVFNDSAPATESSDEFTEGTTSFVTTSETNKSLQEESAINGGKYDSSTENTQNISMDISDHSTLVDTITAQGHLNESAEMTSNVLMVDELSDKDINSMKTTNMVEEIYKSDSDFIYEDAESSVNSDERNETQTTTNAGELQTHLSTSQSDIVSYTHPEKDENSTETRPENSYTLITSDSAKEEYLAALKFSTLYNENIFSTPEEHQTFATVSSEMHNEQRTSNSNIDKENNKATTNDASDLSPSEHITETQQTHDYNEDYSMPMTAENSKHASEPDSFHTVMPIEDEDLSFSTNHSTTFNIFSTLASTLEHLDNLFNKNDSSTNENITVVTTQSSFKSSINESELESSSFLNTSTETKNLMKSSDDDYSSRLKNEFAEYGVLGGVFITGKSKYQGNTTNRTDENSNNDQSDEFLNSEAEQEIKPVIESNSTHIHSSSDDFVAENDAEPDYFSTNAEFNTRYTTKAVLGTEEGKELDYDETKSEIQESFKTEEIDSHSSTQLDITKLVSASTDFVTNPEIQTSITDLTKDDYLDEISVTQTLSNFSTDSEESNKKSFSTSVQQENGPEKGGDWFEPTDSTLGSVDRNETLPDSRSQFENSDLVIDASTENSTEHGPEKGGEIFEPTLPDLFPINNANSNNESDVINNDEKNNATNITDLNSTDTLNKDITSTTSSITKFDSNLEASTDGTMKLDFIPPLPILLKSFPKLTHKSNNSKNSSEDTEIASNYENSNGNLTNDYMADEEEVKPPTRFIAERNLYPSYDFSDIISKVFKAPGYDAEIHASSLKNNQDLKKGEFLRLKRDINTQSETFNIPPPKLNFNYSSDEYDLLKEILLERHNKEQSYSAPVNPDEPTLFLVRTDEGSDLGPDFDPNNPTANSKFRFLTRSEFWELVKPKKREINDKSSDLNGSHPEV